MSEPDAPREHDPVESAAERDAARRKAGIEAPEPSLGARLGQIGALGWITIMPILIGLYIGHLIDVAVDGGITFSAALIMVGAAVGLWSGWRWMNRS
ncbi:putative F0F1-ATPase subunit [Hartmannibacter diazotrophicus]|uniref:Putative F0F1-ATPase subunit n=1 Tax=Hartmannibacter diazotrophicus TaxID=1482074 RepID=A0A2C9D6J6_9HYPH|nr:AtpZ/AtpI family protein [Hartmannibacter diazotrophicus]SON55135.1 putative F0F1-ATPase subunit [Hartmannibacter diazotrophicus]